MLLALPGSLMILFDWGTSEVGVFVVGMLIQTSVFDWLSKF